MTAMLWETALAVFREEATERLDQLEAHVGDLMRQVAYLEQMIPQPPKAKKKVKGVTEPFGVAPDRFYRLLVAAGKVIEGGIDPDTFGVIGKKMNKIGIEPNDIDHFEKWVATGGLDWVKEPWTWNAICRAPKFMLLDWIIRARAYSTAEVKPVVAIAQSDQLEFNFSKFMRAAEK